GGWIFAALLVVLIVSAVFHYLNGGIRLQSPFQRVTPQVKVHLSVLLGLMALTKTYQYYLAQFALTKSRNGFVDGATYTDVHALRPALLLLVAISVIAAGLFLYNVRQQGWLLPGVAVALWALVWVLVANVYPALVQSLVVNPAQNVKESPYIADNITATTSAYGLAGVQAQTFPGNSTITASQVTGDSPASAASKQSLANVPLLDPGVPGMNSVITKQQGFWGYYSMSGPSTDRYELPAGPGGKDQETQVIISARQLNPGGVPGNWVNQRLQFTHGYGAVVAPANQSGVDTTSGYPAYTLKGLPPAGDPSLGAQPRIYFGTSAGRGNSYVIAGSEQEVDYEDSSGNERTYHYSGTGGVAAGGILRRLAFAISFGDYNILISDQVNASSRVLYYRNVVQRLEKVAPFLSYDSDPYPVVLRGRLYWVEDAYTTTDNFPYSEQAKGLDRLPSSSGLAAKPFNYVRNSVKCVVDAYTGQMWFFLQDPEDDPVVQAYQRAFPGLFTPMDRAESLLPGITAHWRYPEDLFTVQTNMYARYHQQSASVFFQGSQAWAIPQNPAERELSGASGSGGGPARSPRAPSPGASYVAPMYELVALPGQTNQSFVLVQPFVPASKGDKQNLTAFMTVSSDPSDYGTMTVYEIPPGQQVDGPRLVSNAVLTNPSISQEISLLDQHGSRVELGNVVLTPIGQSLLYTQPLYVEQQGNGVPSLDDVIVVYNSTAYHSGTSGPSLPAALCRVANPDGGHPFASWCPKAAPPGPSPSKAKPGRAPTTSTTVPREVTTTTVATVTSRPASTTTTTVARTTTTRASATTVATVPVPPAQHGTAAQYLAKAQQYFADATTALKEGDLATYQSDIQAAEAEVALANQAEPAASGTSTPAQGTPATTSSAGAGQGTTTSRP
ncbi:MAG: UPF0182 family protein, partial [Acidimicrobiales bacterium]